MSRSLRLLVLQLLLIFLVAVVSTYDLPNFSQINQDIALFLTPFGIAKNLFDNESLLRPFYFEQSAGQSQLTPLKMTLLCLLYVIMLLNFSWIAKGLKRR